MVLLWYASQEDKAPATQHWIRIATSLTFSEDTPSDENQQQKQKHLDEQTHALILNWHVSTPFLLLHLQIHLSFRLPSPLSRSFFSLSLSHCLLMLSRLYLYMPLWCDGCLQFSGKVQTFRHRLRFRLFSGMNRLRHPLCWFRNARSTHRVTRSI